MKLLHVSCESASVEDCINDFKRKLKEVLSPSSCYIKSAELNLTFGAFMHLSAVLLTDASKPGGNVIVEYSTGRNREVAIRNVLEKINPYLSSVDVVAFRIGTYTTPVTRRTYAVGIVAYNSTPRKAGPFAEKPDRRTLLAHVLSLFDYNPKVLNISELARVFGVSRDTIYYDIQRILEEREKKE
ncbi:hypothetical protein A3L09_07645 [Thermococcus profundus]|uniref:Helix-turn-helix type 11 domain-containing protein n=1 Tax=Thermococcus profundus TaxID=49899 RepID=A0A2Z2MC89_THEPR|nr:HTH domain-containing protein [Thermococcus profundus]ASJ03133.1 hypothetical protein A3L09_07645 [Thermococcus profundus]